MTQKHRMKATLPASAPFSLSRREVLLSMSGMAMSLSFPSLLGASPRVLRVTYYEDFAPYSFAAADGRATGIYVDCLDALLGRGQGMTLVHAAMPWARAQQEVKEGRADAFVTSPTDARREYVDFNEEMILQQDRVVVFAKDNPRADAIRAVTTQDDLKQFVIGTYYGDARINTLFKDMELDLAPDITQAYMKIAGGRVDLTVTDTSIWKYQTRTLGVLDKLDSVLLSKAPPTFLGIRKDYPAAGDVLTIFDQALVAAKADGTLQRIIETYTQA